MIAYILTFLMFMALFTAAYCWVKALTNMGNGGRYDIPALVLTVVAIGLALAAAGAA